MHYSPPAASRWCIIRTRLHGNSRASQRVYITVYRKLGQRHCKASIPKALIRTIPNGLQNVPTDKVISALEAVARRTPTKINSFRYFVREVVSLPDPRNRAWQKKQLGKIVRKIRDSAVGRANYSDGDFVEDVKRACARETVPFDNDMFNELVR